MMTRTGNCLSIHEFFTSEFFFRFLLIIIWLPMGYFLLSSCSGQAGNTQTQVPKSVATALEYEQIYTLIQEAKWNEALKELKRIHTQNPDQERIQRLLAEVYNQLNNPFDAAVLYELLLLKHPTDAQLRWKAVMTYFKAGIINYAILHFKIYMDILLHTAHPEPIV